PNAAWSGPEDSKVRDEERQRARSGGVRGRRSEGRAEIQPTEAVQDHRRGVDPDQRHQRNEPVEHDVRPEFPQDLAELGEREGHEDERYFKPDDASPHRVCKGCKGEKVSRRARLAVVAFFLGRRALMRSARPSRTNAKRNYNDAQKGST